MTDEDIKKMIMDELYWDDRIDTSSVQVEVTGGEAVITGQVPTYRTSVVAENVTRSIPGVRDVDNELMVEYPETMALPQDEQIASAIGDSVMWSPYLESKDLVITVKDGNVVLEGSVDAYWKLHQAELLAYDVAGVKEVQNKLVVAPTKKVSDEVIGMGISDALDRRGNVDVNRVDIKVASGIVTVSGSVDDYRALRTVKEVVERTTGVVGVVDQLVIAPGD